MASWRSSALLILGHGSTINGDSSDPTYAHADTIRSRGVFNEVHEAFWKEEPNIRHSLAAVESERVYLVPNFISSGYFTEQVLPRELGVSPGISLTVREGRELVYCEPVGLHESMTQVLLQRAREVVAETASTLGSACLFVIGHGTGLNENSTKIIYDQVERIRTLGIYAECQAAFMEQEPFIKDWQELTQQPDVVAVPFFIADGLHSYEDIPVLLGMTDNVKASPFANPHCIGNRRLWYARAIGTEPMMAEVLLAQVRKADETLALV